jgi:WD40 repeat protein
VNLPLLGFGFLDDKMENTFCTNTEKESHLAKPKYDVFLSHATLDKPVVEELAQILRRQGLTPWLDIWNLIPGEPWQEALEEALETCAACAVCIGPSGTGPWQNAEMRAAIDLRISGERGAFRVIPVLLPGAVRGEPGRLPLFLRANTWVEFRETLDDKKVLHRLVCGIQGIPPDPEPGEAVAPGACPYRGLQVFDVDDALFFFGREALTGWLLDKLRPEGRSGSRFLAIVGSSGSGKSSLARAGLLAALKRGEEIPGSDAWPTAICKPGPEPLQSLSLAFAKAFRLSDTSTVLDLGRNLLADPRALHIAADLHLSLGDAPANRRLVVLVDQFEEVFTLCPDEAQRRAIIANLLYAATAADGRTVVALTLRADFYGRCATYSDLAAAVSDRQSLVGPMTRDELRSAIERPAYMAGCELEGGLADLLLNEVESQPGCLPLLEHALLQIWQRREGGRRLTIAAYREVGGVAGALEKHAEEVYAGFSEEEKETCRQIFLRLVQVDEQRRATKRRLGLDELASASVVSRLTDARLLTTDQGKQPTVELAHEALLNNWARLKQWIEQDREALRTRRRLDEAVVEWLGRNRDPAFLLEGGRLAQVEEWAERHPGEIGPDARELLAASIAERDQERQRELAQAKALEEEQRRRADAEHQRAEEQAQARRRLKKRAFALSAIALLAVIAASMALYSRMVAEQRRKIAFAGELGERSRTVFSTNPQLGLLLAVQASRLARDTDNPYLPGPQSALHWTLSQSGGIPLPGGKVVNMVLALNRTILFTIGTDHHLRRWDLRDESLPLKSEDLGELPSDVLPHMATPMSGPWLLLAGQKGCRLIDTRTPESGTLKARFLQGEDWLFSTEPFSRDGQWLATRREGYFILRDLTNPEQPKEIVILQKSVTLLRFSPDNKEIAIASKEGLVEIRHLQPPYSTRTSLKLPIEVSPTQIAFQSDGTLIVTTNTNIGVDYWAIHRDNATPGPRQANGCPRVFKIIPGISEDLLLCGSYPGSSGIWKAPAGAESPDELKWPFLADNVIFSPDGKRIVLSDVDGNLYLESTLEERGNPPWRFTVQAPTIQQMVFSPGGRWLLTLGSLEAPRLWDLSQGQTMADFEPRIFRISNASIPLLNAKSEYLRWDLGGRQLRFSTLGERFTTKGVPEIERGFFPYAISADGHWLAGETSDTLKIWEIAPNGGIGSPLALAKGPFSTLAFSPSSTWLAAGKLDGTGLLWRLSDPRSSPYHLTSNPGAPILSIAFSPREDIVATGAAGAVRLRALGERGPRLADSIDHPVSSLMRPQALAFSNDGTWLAIAGEGDRVQLWKAPNREVFLESRGRPVNVLGFSPDGNWLAAGSENGIVQLWRWAGEKTSPTPIVLSGHTGPIRSIVFTSEGLLSGSDDHTVRLWELRPDRLMALGCKSAGRTLSAREWTSYLPSEPYKGNEPCQEFPAADN